jgi:hypothetical protein
MESGAFNFVHAPDGRSRITLRCIRATTELKRCTGQHGVELQGTAHVNQMSKLNNHLELLIHP